MIIQNLCVEMSLGKSFLFKSIFCRSQDSKENEDESLFDKIGKTKDNWLLDFSGSPTKCPVKPGGSIVDLSDDSSDDNFPVECKVQLARVIPKPEMQSSPGAEKQKPDSSGVVNISSSSDVDEPGDERKDPNFEQAGDDASLASESDDASEASTKGSKEREVGKRRSESGNSEKELSFVEARSRRKRKPPTYFGYEDHELSYNLGTHFFVCSSFLHMTKSLCIAVQLSKFFFHYSQLHDERLLEKPQNPREIRTCSLPIARHKCWPLCHRDVIEVELLNIYACD